MPQPKFEIERKFLVKVFPADLKTYNRDEIVQGYFLNGKEVVRLRRTESVCLGLPTTTYIKCVKTGRGIVRQETEQVISANVFAALWMYVRSWKLSKTRYFVPLNDRLHLTAELDAYHGPLQGFWTVEVEFGSVPEAMEFVPPDWFGAEITNDHRFSNLELAGLTDFRFLLDRAA
jgi:CYTH domain-containing protein